MRDHVRRLLAGSSRTVWSLGELLESVRQETGAGDYSTVFRAVGFLEQEGVVQRVELGDGRRRYGPAGPHHHDHVRCTRCGRVAAINGPCLAGRADELAGDATGFRVVGHDLVFVGICPDCQD